MERRAASSRHTDRNREEVPCCYVEELATSVGRVIELPCVCVFVDSRRPGRFLSRAYTALTGDTVYPDRFAVKSMEAASDGDRTSVVVDVLSRAAAYWTASVLLPHQHTKTRGGPGAQWWLPGRQQL